MTNTQEKLPQHFKGKDALGHVVEAQAEGIMASTEVHGAEIPGHISAAADAARETAVVFTLFGFLLSTLSLSIDKIFLILTVFSLGWLVWKTGRATWLAWSRLERLHRVVAEEKWEIEHHRQQERDELRELYRAKGFEGKLLEDVLDVLMADGDRLLRVMVEEELGLSLEAYEHPLKQGLGAFIGSLSALALLAAGFYFYYPYGFFIAALLTLGIAAAVSARFQRNDPIPAVTWNIGLWALAFCVVYYFYQLIG